ncbi:hypothetical protein OH77DRAFT_949237 [Trametes cingulata]|nr:hypothetical protein OH77DRAFT_949237 [Trametes cingulata]
MKAIIRYGAELRSVVRSQMLNANIARLIHAVQSFLGVGSQIAVLMSVVYKLVIS